MAYWGGYIYERNNCSILGVDEDVGAAESSDSRNRCFNCGSPGHNVSGCSEPLNRPLIALSRGIYNFFRSAGGTEPERLHEYEERKAARLHLCDSFDGGGIRGILLRDALGLSDDNGNEEDLPWFERMLQWGYPPGWVSDEDPKLKMRARIQGDDVRSDDSDVVIVIDALPSASDTSDVDAGSCGESDAPSCVSERTKPSKRWVHYPTTLFSSEYLQVFTGVSLPPLSLAGETTFTSERQALWDRIVSGVQPSPRTVIAHEEMESLPPWRRADAFSAFGPVGWQELVNKKEHMSSPGMYWSQAPRDEELSDKEAESDMDVSE